MYPGIERLQAATLAPVLLDPELLAGVNRIAEHMRASTVAVEKLQAPLRSLAEQLVAVSELEPRRRQLIAQLGTRHAHVARGLTRLSIRDVRQLLDAIEHGSGVDEKLLGLLTLIRSALQGGTVTHGSVRRAVRRAQGERRPCRRIPDRRGDHRPRIGSGCTSRPRAPGSGSALLRATAAPARPIVNPRGSPV